jgi:hypothetical protein
MLLTHAIHHTLSPPYGSTVYRVDFPHGDPFINLLVPAPTTVPPDQPKNEAPRRTPRRTPPLRGSPGDAGSSGLS